MLIGMITVEFRIGCSNLELKLKTNDLLIFTPVKESYVILCNG